MLAKNNLQLGTTTNLLHGYNSAWLSAEEGNNALFLSDTQGLELQETVLPTTTGHWGLPEVSLHDNAEKLLDALLPYRIENPAEGSEEASLPAGALLFGSTHKAEAVQKLSATLGVDLGATDVGFALVQLKREDSSVAHTTNQLGTLIHTNPARIPKEFGVNRDFQASASELSRTKARGALFSTESITVETARGYLDFYKKQGTHYISEITFGDVIFQIFAMPKARFEKVKKDLALNPSALSGANAILFRLYTTATDSKGNFGYVKQYGNLLSFSQNAVLTKAIQDGVWKEEVFAQTTSIFALYQDDSQVNVGTLDSDYRAITPIDVQLTSLTLFMEHSRKQIWRRVFDGAALQRFGSSVKPNFTKYCPYDVQDCLKQNEVGGFLSNIATPHINTYKTQLNAGDLTFVAGSTTIDFTLHCNHFYNTEDKVIKIPGNDVLLNLQLVDLETKGYVTTIELTKQAFEKFGIFAQAFFGGLVVQNTSQSERYSYVDGLQYGATKDAQGRLYVDVLRHVCQPPPASYLPRLKNSLQFNFAFAEASSQTVTCTCEGGLPDFLQNNFLWLSQIIPADTKEMDMQILRMRAQDMLHIKNEQNMGAFVPLLPYQEYDKQIDSILRLLDTIQTTIREYNEQIETRKTQELIVEVGQTLNKNIIDSGKLLAGYIQANLAQQQTLEQYYQSIVGEKQNERTKQEAAAQALEKQLFEQQSVLQTAILNYEQALKDFIRDEIIISSLKLGFTVAKDIFTMVSSGSPSFDTLTSIKEFIDVVKMIEQYQSVLAQTNELYSTNMADADKLKEVQTTFDTATDVIMSQLNWDELVLKFEAIFKQVPDDNKLSDKEDVLTTAFKTFVLRGKAFVNVRASIQQCSKEIYNHQMQLSLTKAQVNSLKALNTNLSPAQIADLPTQNIDLIGLTGNLSLLRSQMLGILAKTFLLKDQALRYAYLSQPTVISSFDVWGIQNALVTQRFNTTKAQEAFLAIQPTTTKGIDVVVEIPTSDLREGKVYNFNLPSSLQAFAKYANLRVESVLARVEGVKSTESGKYLLKLGFNGRPFMDRGVDKYRTPVIFNTLYRERTYEYNVEGNQPAFADHGETWSKDVNPVTPFGTWEISMPQTETNKGVSFDNFLTTKVVLTFVLKARIVDQKTLARALNAVSNRPDEDSLLDKMKGLTVMRNWDVVFNMSLGKINDTLEEQYKALLMDDEEYGGRIVTDSTTYRGINKKGLEEYLLQKTDFKYGYPKLKFLVNNDYSGELDMQITSGSIQPGTGYAGDVNDEVRKKLVQTAEYYEVPVENIIEKTIGGKQKLFLPIYNDPVTLKQGASLHAHMEISKVQGSVENNKNIWNVVLDMSKGTFEAKSINIEMNDQETIAFSDAVRAYFVQRSVKFIINSLNLEGLPTLNDLRPSGFMFKAISPKDTTNSEKSNTANTDSENHDPANDVLQLFIQTNNRSLFDYSQTNLDLITYPIPLGYETSMFINSRILFDSILGQTVQAGWKLKGVKPADSQLPLAWKSLVTEAIIKTNIDLSSLNNSITQTDPQSGATTYQDTTYTPKGGNPVPWSLANMTLSPNDQSMLKLYFEEKNKFYYIEKVVSKFCYFGCSDPKTSESENKTDFTLKITANIPLSIQGTGRNQQIFLAINKDTLAAGIEARTSGGGPCSSDDLQAKINKELQNVLPNEIVKNLNLSFESVSVFALKNLLFPSKNYINFEKVYVPGDLVILGNFTKGE